MKNWNDFKTPELPRAKAFTMMFGFTMAVRLSRFQKGLVGLRSAFTMAEILLSLTIIGVVAAITLPSLTGNINERTWNTQRKALDARMSQAIALMPALNGYGTLTEDENGSVTEDTAAETFVTAGLSKVLKINNICDYEHLEDCGLPAKITPLVGSGSFLLEDIVDLTSYNYMFDGSFSGNDGKSDWSASYHQTNTKAAAFETANGESILVHYNPLCVSRTATTTSYYSQPLMCANFIYDLNGNKGPNTVGKDIGFMSVLYPSDSVVVAPVPYNREKTIVAPQYEAQKECKNIDSELRMPNIAELSSMFYNWLAMTGTNSDSRSNAYWSSEVLSGGQNGRGWVMRNSDGKILPYTRVSRGNIWCVRR